MGKDVLSLITLSSNFNIFTLQALSKTVQILIEHFYLFLSIFTDSSIDVFPAIYQNIWGRSNPFLC